LEPSITEYTTRWLSRASLERLVYFLLLAFLVICVFDPADQILRAKIPLFVALWVVTLPGLVASLGTADFPLKSTIYVAAFVAIPMLALVRYGLVNGELPGQALPLFKGYLLISLAIVLVVNRVDLIPMLSATLVVLACFVIVVFVVIQLDYSRMYPTLQRLGINLGVFYLDERIYGNFRLLQVFFATSPMLVVAIAYYFDRARSAPRLLFFALTAISVVGMFLAGTRNNIIVSLLLPFLLWPLYTKRPSLTALCSLGGITILALLFMAYLKAFFDPAEIANNIKLITVRDYLQILSDPATLLFGQGLAVNYNWSARGMFFLTELTYLELIRNFGLFGGLIMLALLALPLISAIFFPTSRRDKALAVAWFLYLVMSATNPMLFSSMGTLILAGLIANIFPLPDRGPRAVKRELA
jgi:hypothetical protein